MSQSIGILHHRPAERERGRRHYVLVGAVLGLMIGALGFAIVESAVPLVRAALTTETAVVGSLAELPGRELPREWRWEREAVDFDHMYRQKESPRLDWIRENGARYRNGWVARR